jgi:biopolymer transport protein ExbD
MGMSIGGGVDEPMMDINMTPLIDVLLVLLILFIITIPVMTHAVKLDMPRPDESTLEPPAPPVIINLEILFDGTITWNGAEIPSVEALDGYFRREAALVPQPELHIRPNKRANYDIVARVLAAAQRNKLTKIGLIGAEEFM